MMSVDTALLLAAFVSLQAAFIYGRFKVFRIDGDTPVGVRLIEVSTFVCIALDGALIATRRGDSALLDLFGVVVALMSRALFAWGLTAIRHGELTAAFLRDVPLALIKSGPTDSFAIRSISRICFAMDKRGWPRARPGPCCRWRG